MKKIPFRLLGYSVLMAAALAVSSCKDRERDATDTQNGDEINGEIYGKGTPADNEGGNTASQQDTTSGTGVEVDANSGKQSGVPSGSSSGSRSGSGSSSGSGSTGSGSSGSGGSGASASTGSTGYGDSNDPLENSSTPATKRGQAVVSSGSSGSGMGTGTGSTGNNSKVTRRSDQLRD